MGKNQIEAVLGAVVLLVAALFLGFAYTSVNLRAVEGYRLSASFTNMGGLAVGSDVRLSGVKVGTVTGQRLDPATYLAVVDLSVDPAIELPRDTVAIIASESLLGGKYLSLEPGGDPEMIEQGGEIEYTQSSPGFEQLLGQVIYSLQNVGGGQDRDAAATDPAGAGGGGGGLLGGDPYAQ